MPRILLWIMILLGVFMLMRGCQKPPQLPSAVSIERVPLGDEGSEYRDGNISLWLDADGNVVSLTQGDELILAPVPPWRRMLRVRLLSGGVVLPMRGGWKGQDGEGGVDFVWEGEDGTIIQKHIRVADDRRGLRISLVITRGEGGPEAATFTVLSGLSPGEEDGGNPGGAITAFGGGTELISFLSLERRQAAARLLGDPLPIGSTRDLRAGQKAARIGLLGPSSAIEVQGLEGPLTLTLEAYRTQRSDRLQNEIEGWLTLPCKPNAPSRWEYELRWSTREEMLVKEPTLRDRSEFQPSSTHTLENGTLIVRLTDRGAAILDATLKGFTQRPNQEPGPDTWIPILRGGVPRGLRSLTLIIQDRERFPGLQATEEALWTLTDSGATWAVYELAAPSGWRVRKTIALPPEGNYALQVTITVIAPEGAEEDTVTYELIGPAGSYIADAYSGITMQDPPLGVRLERRGGEDDD
ncbi:MAG: hypothetical protein O7C98_10330, partial [Planctomycetota bacterium]|nr:hypothetical protein [Planctomycetota bacterium]